MFSNKKTNSHPNIKEIAISKSMIIDCIEKCVVSHKADSVKLAITDCVAVQCGSLLSIGYAVLLTSSKGDAKIGVGFKNSLEAEYFFYCIANYIKLNNSHIKHSVTSKDFEPFLYFIV